MQLHRGTKCRRGVLSCSLSLTLTNTWNYLFYFYSFFILLFLFYYSFYWCITNSGCLCYRQEPSPSTCSCLLSLWHLLWFGSLKLKEELSKKFSGPSDKILLSFSSPFFFSPLIRRSKLLQFWFWYCEMQTCIFFFSFHKDFFFFTWENCSLAFIAASLLPASIISYKWLYSVFNNCHIYCLIHSDQFYKHTAFNCIEISTCTNRLQILRDWMQPRYSANHFRASYATWRYCSLMTRSVESITFI